MKHVIVLDKEDIHTRPNGENVMVSPSDEFGIILTPDAAEELRNDLGLVLMEMARMAFGETVTLDQATIIAEGDVYRAYVRGNYIVISVDGVAVALTRAAALALAQLLPELLSIMTSGDDDS